MTKIAFRLSENPRHFVAPPKTNPEPDSLTLSADGTASCLNERGQVLSVRVYAADLSAGLRGGQPRPLATRASREPSPRRPQPPVDAAADGKAFARSQMMPDRLERAQRREQASTPAAPSTHPSESVRDGQDFVRPQMSPAQRAKLEARDAARRG